jgi:hypothetical protein
MPEKNINHLVTKIDLEKALKPLSNTISKLVVSSLKTEQKIGEMEKVLSTTQAQNDVILNRIDHFVKSIDVYSKKALVHDHRLNEAESTLHLHHKRISSLETRP